MIHKNSSMKKRLPPVDLPPVLCTNCMQKRPRAASQQILIDRFHYRWVCNLCIEKGNAKHERSTDGPPPGPPAGAHS